MTGLDLIRKVQAHGGAIWAEGEHLELELPAGFPDALIEVLRDHRTEVVAALRRSTDLPFPLGCKGLPSAQVEAAEAVMDRWGITDPILRKYNVLSWVTGYFQDREENYGELYEAIRAEQLRLGRILDPRGDP